MVELLLLILVGVVMAPTLYVAGLHDVANSIALPVRTRALTPKIAARLAAGFNTLGVLVALPLGIHLYSWFEFPSMEPRLVLTVVLSSLAALLTWNIFTYLKGMPTSTTHALLAALLGGALGAAAVGDLDTSGVLALPWMTPLLTLLVSPLVAFAIAYLLVFGAAKLASGEDPESVNRVGRAVQSVCVGLTSLGTGLQQGQRFSFLLLLALTAAGIEDADSWMPLAYVAFALLIGAGCLTGGWRIGHVLAHRLVAVDPLRGAVAATTAAGLLHLGSLGLSLPLSTSLTAASSIMGAGSNQRFATVNWRQFRRIGAYWAATPVVTGLLTVILTLTISPLLLV
ncbi:inorganic phosphate transporter [Nesterenkonia flava]|uniref:Inorganic phosphate transporter n=1 Tax=Nesterenkonia flava TaxID=469799 RepID=A0ABU1FUN6_9MICC|nr:inorganic phosphate transporter [Nesterenkonia flava]MDR5712215.1 inorganic phosphate transporter [Nesterenkonia flava]